MNLTEFKETLYLPPDVEPSPHDLRTCQIHSNANIIESLKGSRGIIVGQRHSTNSGHGSGETVQCIALTPPMKRHWNSRPLAVVSLPLSGLTLGTKTQQITP